MKTISPKQQKIYDFIKRFAHANNYPPTYREIAGHFRDNLGTVQAAITGLIKKGYLEKGKKLARGFTLTNKYENPEAMLIKSSVEAVPLYGSVAAGEPVFADSNLQGYIPFPVLKGNAEGIFCLRVIGDSMIERGIFENDILFVRMQNSAEDGEIVVALLENEATVKIFKRDKNKVYLKPANPKYSIITKPFKIIGKVISLKRDFNIN
jgi:repressor LexA